MLVSIIKKTVSLGEIVDHVYNRIMISFKKVRYSSYPQIVGKLRMQNDGQIFFGKSVRFNSRLTSNFVGLNKPCTIAVTNKGRLQIDDFSGFSGVSIYCASAIWIGKYVNCGGNVSIWDTDFHPLNFEDRRVNDVSKIRSMPIIIEDDVFIGANSIILKGVVIGARSVIGAGSVVTKTIPPDEIWAGNPAKFIRRLNNL